MKPARPTRILVPTDYSEAATHALGYACRLAERCNARIVLLYADTFIPPVDFAAVPAGNFDFTRARMVEDEKNRLAAYAKVNVRPGLQYETVIAVNEPVNAIVQATEAECDLVVMGTHGRTGLSLMLFGSVTAAVMRLASVPVIGVNPAAAEVADARRILCSISFDSACREALRYAAGLMDAPITLFRGIPQQELHSTVDELIRLQNWTPSDLEERCEMIVVDNDATAEEIVALAKGADADLIALGVPTDRRVLDVLRGTVAERVVRQSGCPVLTVNTHAAETNAIREAAGQLFVKA